MELNELLEKETQGGTARCRPGLLQSLGFLREQNAEKYRSLFPPDNTFA